jgi:hypothetical protein
VVDVLDLARVVLGRRPFLGEGPSLSLRFGMSITTVGRDLTGQPAEEILIGHVLG